jgi:transcriptional regulator with XRE-family HTH domain
MTPLAQHLVALRRARKLGSYDAARKTGITVGELFGYERGLAMPPVEVLGRMAAAYGVTVDSIVVHAVEQEVQE